MASSLDAIRAKLAAAENRASSDNTSKSTDAIYAFWNIPTDETATLRFLPDGDENNVFFWVERQVIRIPFPGVKGGDDKPVTVQVPCMEMWNETCPVHTEIRPWFKDASLEDLARKYWKKRSYIFQGFVVEDPMNEESPENPIRRFVIGPQIFNIIKGALMDPDMENNPVDYLNGTDFRLAKTSKGKYADYSTSKWARKERSLDENELAAIDEFGLSNLQDFLPKKPGEREVEVIKEMFEASVDGELYDPERWAEYFKPYNLDTSNLPSSSSASSSPAPKAAPAPKVEVEEDTAPWDEEPKAESKPAPKVAATAGGGSEKKSADDILAMIRNR